MKALWQSLQNLFAPIGFASKLVWERLETGSAFNPVSAQMRVDPYPFYERLRTRDPVHRTRIIDGWLLTRYRDVDALLRNHVAFSNRTRVWDERLESLLDSDPPDHTRLRGLVSKAFTPAAVASLRPRIERVVGGLLDSLDGQEHFDVIRQFAYPLPITVIAEMLGVPPEDMDRFEEWSNGIALSVEPILTAKQVKFMRRNTVSLQDYFEEIIELRRHNPQDDMISALIAAEEEGEKLTHRELINTLTLLLVAGNETTRNLIGNGTLALLRHPEQMRRLRDHPEMLDSAVQEFLRYDAPVQLDGRLCTSPIEIGGREIRRGHIVIAAIGAANRDPEAFPGPDRLDIGRQDTSHLSFGRGIHYCLGAPLAVMEAKVAFSALLERYTSMRLTEEPRARKQVVLRGPEQVRIEVEPVR
jgi:cytochrome P450